MYLHTRDRNTLTSKLKFGRKAVSQNFYKFRHHNGVGELETVSLRFEKCFPRFAGQSPTHFAHSETNMFFGGPKSAAESPVPTPVR